MHIPLRYPLEDLPGGIYLPHISTSTAAGISVAIAGNVLISLALNCQKLAHRRLERERENAARPLQSTHTNGLGHGQDGPSSEDATPTPTPVLALLETEPLLETVREETQCSGRTWGSLRRKTSRLVVKEADRAHLAGVHALMPVDIVRVRANGSATRTENVRTEGGQYSSESAYLKSKLWWLGFLLMNLGEMGNFISYAFAPASVVAPLGTFALIANCMFAPLMLKESFRKRDFVGIIIAVLGAVTVVLSANPSDTRLDPDGLMKAISQRPFEVYALAYVAGIVILSGVSEGPAGKRFVYVDVGLCALFGGFTVLSTKAVSTLLTLEWLQIFKEWITYPVIAVLLGTGVGQIRYLNRALMRFDSKIVVPTQFVMFNLSAIVGSALLYGDFQKATFHQLVTFLYGCSATFAGVFIIAWAPTSARPANEDDEDSEHEALVDGDHTPTLPDSTDTNSTPASARTVKLGSLARRNCATLVVPDGVESQAFPVLRNRPSVVSLYGFSPAQRVLLMSPSPQDDFARPPWQDLERDGGVSPAESTTRWRTASWLNNREVSRQASPRTSSRRYGATSTSTPASRENSRTGTRNSTRSRSVSPDPFA